MKIAEWSDQTLSACSDISGLPSIMELLRHLATASSKLRLEMMREAVAMGDYASASTLEAEARAWEQFPSLIMELAAEWKQRSRN